MNPQQARERVAETFPQPFNKTKFLEFSRNLLNKFDESKAAQWNATYVKDAFKPHVSRFERLGTYTSPDDDKLDVLIVHLTNESKLERARTAIRNFVADHLKQRDGKDAALVAFVSPTERQWRFSYVKMEYAAVETDSGKVGVETRLTPARRYSYIVGEGESCHTAQTRFLALLQDTENYPKLAQLEDAFSVDAVTTEFFKQYAALFGDINAGLEKLAGKDKTIGEEFKKKHVSTVDFAKKLMGQIVFLYFLQKKGWLGVAKGQDWGTGPHDFLRQLVGHASSQSPGVNIFNEVLEPLFYDTLATDRGHEAWCGRFKCRIPFLNGGLFEPLADYDWRKTDITLPNKLFTNTDRNDAGDIGTGVLDVFDRYNFTVNEAEPLEKEVAIDPEMLGKVFENLIEENRRKGLGSFYTPREIVHYMCQESLINYLDAALNSRNETLTPALSRPTGEGESSSAQMLSDGRRSNDTRMADNAPKAVPSPGGEGQGEGGRSLVPRADLETFVHLGDQISHYEAVETRYAIKMPKSIEQHAQLIDEKLADITVCDPAVGSGAFPVGMMTEIVRTRSALTPYHFKRHAIQNCLYGVDIDPGAVEIAKLRLWLSLVVDEEDAKQIKPLPNLFYKIVTGNSLLGVEKNLFNQQLFQKLEKLKPLYFDQSDQSEKAALRRQIEDLIHELTNGKEAFDFEIYFSEVFHRKGGFDVLIANPPYVRMELIKRDKSALEDRFPHLFAGRADLYVYFYGLALDILRDGGCMGFISSNSFLNAKFGEKLRKHLRKSATVSTLIDFAETHVFDAVVEPAIVILRKVIPQNPVVRCVKWQEAQSLNDIQEIANHRAQAVRQDDFSHEPWRLIAGAEARLLEKLNRAPQLGKIASDGILYGVKTGLNAAFIINDAKRRELCRDKRSSEIIKPFIRGRDISKWTVRPTEAWLIYTYHGIDITSYPLVKEHLRPFKDDLEKRATQQEWYELQQPQFRYSRLFAKPKVVYQDISRTYAFAYDQNGSFCGDTTFVLPTSSLAVVGILQSNVMRWWAHTDQGVPFGGFLRLKAQYMARCPIAEMNGQQDKALSKLVDRILAAKQRDTRADVSALEREIDELVYALYGLTPEEIHIVEGAAK